MASLIIDLSGEWEFSPDGCSWGSLQVPGCWEAQGYPADLEGPVLYRRHFLVPADGVGQRARLHFGAVSYFCRIWLNGQYVGRHEGLWDYFSLDISPYLRWGAENVLQVEVTKPGRRFPWRESLCGFLPEIALPFGGLWQPVEVRVEGMLGLGRPYVRATRLGQAEAQVVLRQAGSTAVPVQLEGEVLDSAGHVAARVDTRLEAPPGMVAVRLPFRLRDPLLWEPESPHRYTLRLLCRSNGAEVARVERAFGVRELRARGPQLQLNGHPLLVRGVLHWGFYPRTIAPAPTDEEICAELQQLKALGFNLVKHCLFVPPERYQELADELGMLLWQEWPLWPPTVTAAQRRRALCQVPRLVRQRRGHPSLVLYTVGCELDASADAAFLRRLYRQIKRLDPGTLARDNSGSGQCYGGLLEDFADFDDYHFYAEPERLGPLIDAFAAPWRRPRPWLFGEFCDSDTFRSRRLLERAVPSTEAWWLSDRPARNPLSTEKVLPILDQERRLGVAGLRCDEPELIRRSHAWSWQVRKLTLERARLSPRLCGYVVTSLRDVPTVTSGLFDDCGRPKWPSEQLRTLNADTVLLLVRPPERCWVAGGDRLATAEAWSVWAGERYRRSVVVSHFGRGVLSARVRWRVSIGDTPIAEGILPRIRLRPGRVEEVGIVDFRSPETSIPSRLDVRLWLEGETASVENSWLVWVVPRRGSVADWLEPDAQHVVGARPPLLRLHFGSEQLGWLAGQAGGSSPGAGLLVADRVDAQVLDHARRGGAGLVVNAAPGLLPTRSVPFWREGLPLLLPHPALAALPHDGYADAAWDCLASDRVIDPHTLAQVLGDFEAYYPIVRRLDCRTFDVADYAAEVVLGRGRLLVTTLGYGQLGQPTQGWQRCPLAAFILGQFLMYLAGRTLAPAGGLA